ncbi:MAG TPA: hypothetical protein DGT23_23125 [Micromonosporaceae bacterium]|nr:hypothetical protein [Micromonosporaceae bacterium]
MTVPASGPPSPPRPINLLRLGFALIGVIALICGYLGLDELLSTRAGFANGPLDIIYYDLQLFVLGSPPLDEGGPMPPLLDIARFAAPAVTIYALAEASRVIFASEVRRLRTRSSRGHAIVCGQTMTAASVARRLRAAGERVVVVQPAELDFIRTLSPLWVIGDARDPDVLRAAGVRRATSLYACTDDSATNTAIALAAGRRRPTAGPLLRVYAQISDPDLCLTLQARYLGPVHSHGLQLDFFHLDQVAARQLCSDSPLGEPTQVPPRVLVAGLNDFGSALVVELARYWRGRAVAEPAKLPLLLVDPRATELVQELGERYPFLADTCDLSTRDEDLAALLHREALTADRMFICDDDEEHALKTALIAERIRRDPPRTIVVRLDRLADLREAFDDETGEHFDQLTTRLRIFGVTQAAGDPALIGQDLVERLARVVHDSYLRTALAGGRVETDRMSHRPWEELPESLRAANRSHAEDFGRKLRLIGCLLSPRVGPAQEHELTESEIDLLARLEHERWVTERLSQGWQFAERQDDARKLHPALVEWADLPVHLREPNFQEICAMPGILADAGFRIVRR